jgi:hypothetical protein
VGKGVRTRTPGGIREPQGEGEAGFRPWLPGGGYTGGRGPRFGEPAAPMRPVWGGHTLAVGRMVAPAGTAGAGGSRRGGPDRRMDNGDPLGRAGTRNRSPAALVRERGEGVGCVPCQAELELGQEGTMDRTPQPSGADCREPLGPHRRQNATDARMGGQGHGLPTLILGVLGAEAPLSISDGEEAVVGQRDPVAISAPVLQDLLPALRGRLTVDAPPCGPDHLGPGQVGTFLTHQVEKQPAKERLEGMDGHQGGRAGGPPRGPVGGDPTGRHQTVPMWGLPQAFGGGDRNEAVEFRNAIVIERVQGTPQRIIIEMLGFDLRGDEPVRRFVLKK